MALPPKISEDFVISLFKESARGLDRGETGIGDDAAVWPENAEFSTLVTTDLLVEDVHFLRSEIPPRDLGFKSLAVNLSDIAAMGGTPERAFLSLALPADLPPAWLAEWNEGFQGLASEFSVRLMGGDTTRSPGPLFINVMLTGKVPDRNLKLRSTAKAGDRLYVTGFLGDSRAGLQCLLDRSRVSRSALEQELIQRHHRPRPHVREGQWLGARHEVTAMMDVSDGLRKDLGRLAEASQVGFEVELEKLPVSPELKRFAKDEASRIACDGGEDYVLLLAVDPAQAESLEDDYARIFSIPLTRIGTLTEPARGPIFFLRGQPLQDGGSSFEHF